MMTKWLRDLGLTVNENKTEICLFHITDHSLIDLQINNVLIRSNQTINVLGVLFDSKLQWNQQTDQTIKKANKSILNYKNSQYNDNAKGSKIIHKCVITISIMLTSFTMK